MPPKKTERAVRTEGANAHEGPARPQAATPKDASRRGGWHSQGAAFARAAAPEDASERGGVGVRETPAYARRRRTTGRTRSQIAVV